jgi:hypothetical protein
MESIPSWQVAQRLGTFVRNSYRGQITGSITAGQLVSIAPIRLHSIAGLDRHQSGRYHLALNPQLRQRPGADQPSLPGLERGVADRVAPHPTP